jgi:hypothetical protein
MLTYHLHEADLLLPEGLVDNTVNAFVLPAEDGAPLTVVVTRDPKPARPDAFGYADHLLVEAAKRLPGYDLKERVAVTVGQQQTIEARFAWRTPEGAAVEQRQTFVFHRGAALIFTMTTRANDMERATARWRLVLDSVRLRA